MSDLPVAGACPAAQGSAEGGAGKEVGPVGAKDTALQPLLTLSPRALCFSLSMAQALPEVPRSAAALWLC